MASVPEMAEKLQPALHDEWLCQFRERMVVSMTAIAGEILNAWVGSTYQGEQYDGDVSPGMNSATMVTYGP